MSRFELHPLGIAHLIAGALDPDVRVVPRRVLQQERRQHPERRGDVVLDDALDDLRDHRVGAAAGVQLTTEQTGEHQRQDDDKGQDDGQRVAEDLRELRRQRGTFLRGNG